MKSSANKGGGGVHICLPSKLVPYALQFPAAMMHFRDHMRPAPMLGR